MTLRAFVQESGDANVRKAYNKYLFDTNEENKNTFRAAVEALPEENAHVRRALLELVDIQGQYRDHAANRIMADIVDVYQKAAGGTDGARTFRLLRRILDDNFDGGFERKTMARITTHSELLGLLGNIKWVTCKSGVDRTSFSVNVSNAIELTRQNLAHTPGLEAMPVEIYNRIVDNIHELKTLRRNPGEAGFAEYLARAQAIGSAGDFHTNYNDVDAVLNAISNAYVADVEMQSKPTQIFSTLLPGNKTGSGGFFAWITGGMNLIGLVFWPTGRPVAGFQVLGKYRGS